MSFSSKYEEILQEVTNIQVAIRWQSEYLSQRPPTFDLAKSMTSQIVLALSKLPSLLATLQRLHKLQHALWENVTVRYYFISYADDTL